MNRSETISSLAKALVAAQGEFANVKKDSKNPFFKSNYADLASNVETARPVLAKHGLAVTQLPGFDVDKGNIMLTTMLLHMSGEFISQELPMPVLDLKAQSIGSALTYARRYAFQSILGLAAEDDDGNAASGRHEGHEQPISAPRQAPKPTTGGFRTISEPQQKRLFALAAKANASTADIKRVLAKCGYEHSKDIKAPDYEAICALFETGQWADITGDPSLITEADTKATA